MYKDWTLYIYAYFRIDRVPQISHYHVYLSGILFSFSKIESARISTFTDVYVEKGN